MRILLLASSLWLSLLANASAQDVEMQEPRSDVAGTSEVIGGRPVSSTQWPATRIFYSGIGGCTSTVVGARVVLTAAHCVQDGSTAQITGRWGNISLECYRHPDYATNSSMDFALCRSSSVFTNIPFETINTSIAYPIIGDEITLLGYGCTTAGGFNRDFGVLHRGIAKVARQPTGNNATIVTADVATTCYGDSGGAAYLEFRNRRRVIIGVNAQSDRQTVAYTSSTANENFVIWARKWGEDKSAPICGVSPVATGCR